MNNNIVFLNRYNMGGTFSFTAHLVNVLGNNDILIRPTENPNGRLEKKTRYFGWGIDYLNIPYPALRTFDKLFLSVIAWDSDWIHPFLSKLAETRKMKLVIHHPKEIRKSMVDNQILEKMEQIITIRPSLRDFVESKFGDKLKNPVKVLTHPFYSSVLRISNQKQGVVNITRVANEKNIDMIYYVNKKLNDESKRVKFYGSYQGMDVFRMFNGDKETVNDFKNNHFMGGFDKEFESTNSILRDKKFMIDLTIIKADGGGTQYTFLEAIDNHCCIILHRNWIESVPQDQRIFIEGYNCLAVSTKDELLSLLENQNKIDVSEITKNAYNSILRDYILKNNYKWIENLK